MRISLITMMICGCTVMWSQDFYFGADLSYMREMQDCGVTYKENGLAKEVVDIFVDHHVNLARFRLWHTPAWEDGLNNGFRYSSLEDVILSMFFAKSRGLQTLLDFHLSDTWADPSHQVVPAAWASVVNELPALKDSLHNYIYRTLITLNEAGLLPEIVQIGNETNKGILLSQQVNDQGWSVDWNRNAPLFNEAIAAVREVETESGKPIRIALHIADPSEVHWWIDQFWSHGVQDFDVIGISYYYQYHDDLIPAVGNFIKSLRTSYPGKEVMIFETAYPWTSGFEDSANNLLGQLYPGYSFSPENQKLWLIALTQKVIDNGGRGVIYWEPGWQSTDCETLYGTGSNWENNTFFDFEDNLLADGGIAWAEHQYDFPSAVEEISRNKEIMIYQQGDGIWIRFDEGYEREGKISSELFGINGEFIERDEKFVHSSADEKLLDIQSLVSGLYVIRFQFRGDLFIGKLFIQNN